MESLRIQAKKPVGDVRGWYLEQLLIRLQSIKSHPLEIIETGTFDGKDDASRAGNGWSTWYIAKFVKEHAGDFSSIDNRPEITEAAYTRLKQDELDTYVDLMTTDSRDHLWNRHLPIDFAYLDSLDDVINLSEYLLVTRLLRRPALVVIDDCFDVPEFAHMPLNGYNKGKLSLEFATLVGTPTYHLGRALVMEFTDV